MLAPIRRDGFEETPIPLDGLILSWWVCVFKNMTLIIEDGPHNPKSSQADPWGDPVQNTRFLHLLARNRSIPEDGPDLAWKLARVSTGRGVGGRVNPPEGSNTPTKVDGFRKFWDGFGMVWGWFWDGLGVFSGRFRTDFEKSKKWRSRIEKLSLNGPEMTHIWWIFWYNFSYIFL